MTTVLYSLFSGSGGNATYLRHGNTEILIDMGMSARAICTALTEIHSAPERISAVFITHEHIDHVRGLDVFCKKYAVPVHIVRKSADNLPYCPGKALSDCFSLHETLFEETVGNIAVRSFATSHDSASAVGYRFDFLGTGVSAALATDTGEVTAGMREEMTGARACVLECNHDVGMLQCGPYPYPLKRRILSRTGHLSGEDCAAFAAELEASGTKHLLLAHLSKENNTPSLAEKTVSSALTGGMAVRVAEPDRPVLLWEEEL